MDPDDRRHGLVAVAVVALILGLVAAAAWPWVAARVRGERVATEPTPVAEAPAPASGCTLAIGPEFPPTGSSLTVAPGETVVIIATCAPGVTVVDLVIALPPPQGVLFVWAMERLRETPAGVLWRWTGEMTPDAAGMVLAFYAYADGRPAGEPVMLTVTPSP